MSGVKLVGLGYATGNQKVTNDDLAKIVDTNHEWIQSRTGINSRYISPEENTSDLAVRASIRAIEKSGLDQEEIDCVIVATFTPDSLTPATACLVQAKLGLTNPNIFAFDVNAACSGFLYAFNIADALLESKRVNTVLLLGADVTSKVIDWQDRSTCILFGDGAGALILQRGDGRCEHIAHSSGDLQGHLQLKSYPLIKDFKQTHPVESLSMNGNEVFRFAVKVMREAMEEMLEKVGCSLEDIDLLIPHQANIRIINHVLKSYNFNRDKVLINLDQCGNTSAASIIMALAQADEENKLKVGSKILLVGFGAGFTWASTYIEL